MTKAQRNAKKKYQAKTRRFLIEFYPTERDLIEHLEKQPNKQGYIKRLIRADVEKEQK